MAVAALIFDMDGLLLDTETLYLRATQALLAPYGHTVEVAAYAEWIGRDVTWADFQAVYPCDLTEQEAWAWLRAEFHRLCAAELTLRPGVAEFLGGVGRGYRKAIASSTARRTIEQHLTQLGLLDVFPIRASGKEVAHGKPAPDVFLDAARQLDVPPAECVVFEDSPHGVQGAKAAGMRAVAVPTELTAHCDFQLADLRVTRLDEVSAAWLAGPAATARRS